MQQKFEETLRNLIPNTLSKESTLSGLQKKGELLREGLGLWKITKNVLFLFVLAFILINYFKISTLIVIILIGTEIFTTVVAGYIKIRSIIAVYAIKTQDNAKSYRAILITSEYYELIKSVFGVVASIISITIVALFFSGEISNFVIQNIPFQSVWLKYSILIFVIFRLFDFILRFVRYGWIKNLEEYDDFAKVNQEYQMIDKKLKLIQSVPSMSIVVLILFLIDIPYYIPSIFGGFMILIIILSIIELKRIKNISFDNKNTSTPSTQYTITEYADEQITGSIFGVLKTASGFKDIFKPFGMSILGSGKMYYPENTLLITNFRILLIQVPVTGGEKVVGETDYVTNNFFFNRGEIRQNGEELLKTNSLSQILKLTTNDILYQDIKSLTLKQMQIIIEKITGEKLSYVFMDKEYLDPLKHLCQLYLKERFIVV